MGGDARLTLQTLEQATLASARAEGQAIRDAAERHAQLILTQAQARAQALLAERRAAAERQADMRERRHLAQARTQAREVVLRAQRSVLTRATEAAHTAAQGLAGDPRYAGLLAGLAAEARERLALAGPGPVQLITPAEGGLIARAGSLQIDYSLSAQVERALQSLASQLERLWL